MANLGYKPPKIACFGVGVVSFVAKQLNHSTIPNRGLPSTLRGSGSTLQLSTIECGTAVSCIRETATSFIDLCADVLSGSSLWNGNIWAAAKRDVCLFLKQLATVLGMCHIYYHLLFGAHGVVISLLLCQRLDVGMRCSKGSSVRMFDAKFCMSCWTKDSSATRMRSHLAVCQNLVPL